MNTNINFNPVVASSTTGAVRSERDTLAKILSAEPAVSRSRSTRPNVDAQRNGSTRSGAEPTGTGQPIRLASLPGEFVSGRQATRMVPLPGSNGGANAWRGAPVLNTGSQSTRPVPIFRGGFTIEVDSSTKPGSSAGVGTVGTVAQAPSSSTSASAKLSIEQLRDLNPLANVRDHDSAEGWDDMFNHPAYVDRIPGMTGLVTKKLISIGEGISFPVGTTISNEYGINSLGAPQNQPGREARVEFQLPNGKTIKLTPDRDKQSGLQMTRITLDDGRFFRVIGSPFFNPKTGSLAKVQAYADITNGSQYKLRESLLDGSLGMQVRNEAMSGKDAEAALRAALR